MTREIWAQLRRTCRNSNGGLRASCRARWLSRQHLSEAAVSSKRGSKAEGERRLLCRTTSSQLRPAARLHPRLEVRVAVVEEKLVARFEVAQGICGQGEWVEVSERRAERGRGGADAQSAIWCVPATLTTA